MTIHSVRIHSKPRVNDGQHYLHSGRAVQGAVNSSPHWAAVSHRWMGLCA